MDKTLLKITKLSDSSVFQKAIIYVEDLIVEKDYDNALKYADELIEISENIKYLKGMGEAYMQKGNAYNEMNQRAMALLNYEQAIGYYKKAGYMAGVAAINISKSRIEYEKGKYAKSIDYLIEASGYYEKNIDSVALSNVYNNMGNSYAGLGNFEDAKKYYKKSITLRKEKKISHISIMNNLALLYIDNKKPDSAKVLLLESLKIGKESKEVRSIAQSYSILAKVALFNKDFNKAKKYYDSTLVEGKKTNWQALLLNAKQQMGLIAIYNKDYNKAEEFLTYTRKELSELEMTSLLLKNYKFSLKLDSLKGNYKQALIWQKKYQELSDQRVAEISAKKIEDTEARYKAELEQIKLIDEKEKREQQTNAELFKYRVFAYVILGVLLGISFFLILIIRARKERKRYINELNESNEIKNKLFSIISHDLKNEIHGLEGSLNLINDNEISMEEFEEIIPLLANRTHQTSIMLNNLLNWSKSQLKELNAKPTSFDITEVICDKFNFFEQKAQQKDIKLINDLNSTVIYADKDMFGIVAQNLIANAIKFCEPGDSIALVSEEKGNCYEISFKDTGVGIDPNHIDKLFTEEIFTTSGTQNETGTGLGLKICKELIELNQGKIDVKSRPGEGSIFRVVLPKVVA
ncbi:tetratricopeptide repeat-containing sensor histidine kinase [Aquimarina sp. 2201CG5-10]|uniref:ATP-binding protein n=1 Tax=Aquimarina callyspongiae TaxID=3098150 RepID=UPI002AB4926E|nr:tetratricopeptide repeat-containing sensor histidine kinase [Aquimarina sp. 2201CG5-10]MDY8138194.1 tetratricopeptide repeat-containing sensor histidine kinase [Aquimarina sp. 2201CG5-10]